MDFAPASAAPTPQAPHQRARGELRLSFKRRGDATVLDGLRQDGCLKARFPRVDPPAWHGAVTLNSAGGVAGGDRLATCITAGAGTQATVASQAAERVYRALPGAVSAVATTLHVEQGAALEWLPQETILFDRCALRRTLDVHLAQDAWFLGVESLVFGRTAMDEEVQGAAIHDRIAVRRAGRLVLHDAIRLEGPVASLLQRPAIGRGARAVATLIHAGPDAAAMLDRLREALVVAEAGASVVDGLLVARIVAPTGAALRRAVVAGLNILRGGRTLPRVWLC
jgi:urease accessory protein